MRNSGNRRWYKNYCNTGTCLAFGLSIYLILTGISRQSKTPAPAYVQTRCLVKNRFLENCGIIYTRYGSPRQCFRPMWLIKYMEYGINVTTTITESVFYVNDDDDSVQFNGFKKYEIGKIYPCYHLSGDYQKALWSGPGLSIFHVFIICGTLSALCGICLLLLAYCSNHCFGNNDHNNRRQNTQPHAATAPTTRGMGTENIPLTLPLPQIRPTSPIQEDVLETPPPPYTPSTASAGEQNNPITPPPPPYTPSTIHTERDEENIPLTPPPAYVPSSI